MEWYSPKWIHYGFSNYRNKSFPLILISEKTLLFLLAPWKPKELMLLLRFWWSSDYICGNGPLYGRRFRFSFSSIWPKYYGTCHSCSSQHQPFLYRCCKNIGIPSIVIAGANDCVAPPVQHQLPMYDALASTCKTYVTITGGSHCQFANANTNCSLGELTCSPPPDISPMSQQNITSSLLLSWLNYYLKNESDSGVEFQNLITTGAELNHNKIVCYYQQEKVKNKRIRN